MQVELKPTKVLIIGDLHFDDYNPPRYYNYKENCIDVMNRIIALKEKTGADLVIQAGDFIGLRQSAKFFSYDLLTKIFEFLNKLGKPVIIKGNHDWAENSAYDFIHKLGYFYSPDDIMNKEILVGEPKKGYRIHLYNYGEEDTAIQNINKDNYADIAIAHAQYTLGNSQVFGKAYDLRTFENWNQCKYVIAGHIHKPAVEELQNIMQNGKPGACKLVVLGCPTRTSRADNHSECNYVLLEPAKSGAIKVIVDTYELNDYGKVFIKESNVLATLSDEELEEKANLAKVLDTLSSSGVTYGDVEKYLAELPGIPDKVRSLANDYLLKAKEGLK